jgi:hypothetical protein
MSAPAVAPLVERGKVYRSEYTYQRSESRAYRRAVGAAARTARERKGLFIVGELVALRLAKVFRPEIRTRRQLFKATAWQPFKIVLGAGQVRYVVGALEAWAENGCSRPH